MIWVILQKIKGVICRLTHTANPSINLSKADFANAYLIAAAPEMYDLLESLDVYNGSTSSVKLQDKIDALLAKARGE
jgi:hypothetical protein